ncbi:MAG: hypothetical protein ACTSVA_03820 [Candidatus Njordarchaeales archaeon]
MLREFRIRLLETILKALRTNSESEKLIAPVIDGIILSRLLTSEKFVLFWDSFSNADITLVRVKDGWLAGLSNDWTIRDILSESSRFLAKWRASRHNFDASFLEDMGENTELMDAYLASCIYGIVPSVVIKDIDESLVDELSSFPLVTLEDKSDFLINAMLTGIIVRELGKADYADFDAPDYEEYLGVNFGELDGVVVKDETIYILETKVRIGRRAAQNFKIDIYTTITKLLALREALPDYDIKAILVAFGKIEKLSDRIIMALKRTRLHIINGGGLIDCFRKLFMEWFFDILGIRVMDPDTFRYLFEIKMDGLESFLNELKSAVKEDLV